MFETLRRIFADPRDEAHAGGWAFDDPRLAVAVLMIHLIAVDGGATAGETEAMEAELGRRYALKPPEISTLIATARRLTAESTELRTFAARLARRLPIEERNEVIESLFRVALVDGSLHEFEDDLVWRIADLLGVAPQERVAIRKRLEADLAREPSLRPRS
jgi:uncharacterized tellurite resistance protein B-like protein